MDVALDGEEDIDAYAGEGLVRDQKKHGRSKLDENDKKKTALEELLDNMQEPAQLDMDL